MLDPDSLQDEAFVGWLRAFNSGRNQRRRDAVYKALAAVERLGPCKGWGETGEAAVWLLRYLALRACWSAENYSDNIRANAQARERLERASNILGAAARELHDPHLAVMLERAALRVLPERDGEALPLARDLLRAWSGDLLHAAAGYVDEIPAGRFRHRFGCLAWLHKPRLATKAPKVSTALAINLEHVARQYTGAGRVMGQGLAMPRTGKPCAPQAAAIAAAIFREQPETVQATAKSLMRDSRPHLVAWP